MTSDMKRDCPFARGPTSLCTWGMFNLVLWACLFLFFVFEADHPGGRFTSEGVSVYVGNQIYYLHVQMELNV